MALLLWLNTAPTEPNEGTVAQSLKACQRVLRCCLHACAQWGVPPPVQPSAKPHPQAFVSQCVLPPAPHAPTPSPAPPPTHAPTSAPTAGTLLGLEGGQLQGSSEAGQLLGSSTQPTALTGPISGPSSCTPPVVSTGSGSRVCQEAEQLAQCVITALNWAALATQQLLGSYPGATQQLPSSYPAAAYSGPHPTMELNPNPWPSAVVSACMGVLLAAPAGPWPELQLRQAGGLLQWFAAAGVQSMQVTVF